MCVATRQSARQCTAVSSLGRKHPTVGAASRLHRIRRVQCDASTPHDGCYRQLKRRELLSTATSTMVLILSPGRAAAAAAVEVLSEQDGFGQHPARQGDLVLVHYTGTVAETGQVFDTTRGGLKYRDGGAGVLRPLAFRLSGYPQPGVCSGLQEAIVGMKIGGQKSVLVPPEAGFGSMPILAPYAPVPANSTLRYDIELVRVSSRGPDEMFKGISSCSAGGDSARTDGCADITPAEFY